ncbi:hypothetical protein [Brevibacillus parabrevis]|uniref:Uncharacterized protein n=1 Tax=Brevibacillus parabrevis TaxID=54914 RepID=A0A4Y3PE72_BREPA|nr:hypothetical protein [Brevibacillus parabrevis]RNB96199.1 hypothetical protein EDM60_08005 [Brevibacillus parabrevis]GEB32820.1 hypothetical protein BPA01_24000 [Brevibacillus parabrevis]
MNEAQKNQKLKYLREQRENPTGNYRRYLVNTYNYILNDSRNNNKGWSKASSREMVNYVYEGSPDHMGYELVEEYKKTLRDMGYIKFQKENNEWRTYVIKDLDF